MGNRKQHIKALEAMKIEQLREAAASFDPPIKLAYNATRKRIINAIIEREDQAANMKSAINIVGKMNEQRPANPDFEQAVSSAPVEAPPENRGGARPGAGRPAGLTDEKARVKNLPQYSSAPVRQACVSLFDWWATLTRVRDIALSSDEAEVIALPITQLQEYYFPGMIPEIAAVWIGFIYAATIVVKPRIELINELRRQKAGGQAVNQPTPGGSNNGDGKEEQPTV